MSNLAQESGWYSVNGHVVESRTGSYWSRHCGFETLAEAQRCLDSFRDPEAQRIVPGVVWRLRLP